MPNIEAKHPGILRVPDGKNVEDLPQSHFEKLVDDIGYEKVIRALTNLEVWNKNKNKSLSSWASNMADKLKKKYKKEDTMLKQLLEKANRKCEMQWKVLVFDPEKDNELIDEFKGFDNIDCAAMKRREILDKHPNRTVEIIAESVKQKNEFNEQKAFELFHLINSKYGEDVWERIGNDLQVMHFPQEINKFVSKHKAKVPENILKQIAQFSMQGAYESSQKSESIKVDYKEPGHTTSSYSYKNYNDAINALKTAKDSQPNKGTKITIIVESSLNDLNDAENDEMRALDREEIEANESSQINEMDDKTLVEWLTKEHAQAMKLAKFTGYNKEDREYHRGRADAYARLADKFGKRL